MKKSPGSELISKLKRLRASLSKIGSSSESDDEVIRKPSAEKRHKSFSSDSDDNNENIYSKHSPKGAVKKKDLEQKNYTKYKLNKTFNKWNEKTYSSKSKRLEEEDSDSSADNTKKVMKSKLIQKKKSKSNTLKRVNKSIDEFGAKRASSKATNSNLQPKQKTKYIMHQKIKTNRAKAKIENKNSESSSDSEDYQYLSMRYTQPRAYSGRGSPVYRKVSKEIEISDTESDSDDQFVGYNRLHPTPMQKKHLILDTSSDSDDFMHSLSRVIPAESISLVSSPIPDEDEKKHTSLYGSRLNCYLNSSASSESEKEAQHIHHLQNVPVSSSSSDDDLYLPRKQKVKDVPQRSASDSSDAFSPPRGRHAELRISRPVALRSPSPPPALRGEAAPASLADSRLADTSSDSGLTKPVIGLRTALDDSDSIDELIRKSTEIANTPPSIKSPVSPASISDSSEESDDELMRRVSSHLARSRCPAMEDSDLGSATGGEGAESGAGSGADEEWQREVGGIPKANTPEWKEWLRKQVDDFDNQSENEELSPESVIVASEAVEPIKHSPTQVSNIMSTESSNYNQLSDSNDKSENSSAEELRDNH